MKINKNRLSYKAQLSRHSHDLHAGYSASLTTGQLIPQYFHILSPGDKVYNDLRLFCRLQNVVTAFLGEIDVHMDAFFVPFQMMYTPFGQMFAQTNDYLTSFIEAQNLENKDGWPLLNIETWNDFNPSVRLSGHTECIGKETARLFDALDVNPLAVLNDVVKQTAGFAGDGINDAFCHNPNIAPWIFAAYQAIYQKYYRNDEFEKLSVSDFNFDKFYNVTSFTNDKMRYLRYVQRPSDYFTDTRVSPMFSAVNASWDDNAQPHSDSGGTSPTPNSSIMKILNYLSPSNGTLYGQEYQKEIGDRSSVQFENVSISSSLIPADTGYQLINTANIRALFAVDKFARIYGRADKTYDAQILAHFGVNIPHDVKHDLTHIGHFHAVLQSDPIYGTANAVTSEDNQISAIGQVGGQGQCVVNGKFDFTAPVHGVFMVVAYVVTKPRYFGTFSKLHLVSDRLHLPIPEFDKLGAQPLYYFEFNPSNLSSTSGMLSARAGWQNRYQEFKSKYNRVSLTYFGGAYDITVPNNNIFAPWVISRLPFDKDLAIGPSSSAFINPDWFFERADSLDPIMVNGFEPQWSNSYFRSPHMMFQSDPIISEFYNDAKLVSWMSETGEPDL